MYVYIYICIYIYVYIYICRYIYVNFYYIMMSHDLSIFGASTWCVLSSFLMAMAKGGLPWLCQRSTVSPAHGLLIFHLGTISTISPSCPSKQMGGCILYTLYTYIYIYRLYTSIYCHHIYTSGICDSWRVQSPFVLLPVRPSWSRSQIYGS